MDQMPQKATQSTPKKKKVLTPSTIITLIVVSIGVFLVPNISEFQGARQVSAEVSAVTEPFVSIKEAPPQSDAPIAPEYIRSQEQLVIQQQQALQAEYEILATRTKMLQESLATLQEMLKAQEEPKGEGHE